MANHVHRRPEAPHATRAIPRRARALVRLVSTAGIALSVTACDNHSDVRAAEASAAATDPARRAERDWMERARQDSIVRSRPGYIIDSILPVDEEIRRFQATLGPPRRELEGGAGSRSALVRMFVRAIERNDTTTLEKLVVDRAEFGYLIYPASANTRPPYRLSPELVWLQRSASTDKAASRLFRRFGGKSIGFRDYSCPDRARREGENRIWTGCVVRRGPTSDSVMSIRLFGPIIARGGRYKFLSLANGL